MQYGFRHLPGEIIAIQSKVFSHGVSEVQNGTQRSPDQSLNFNVSAVLLPLLDGRSFRVKVE